MILLFIADTGRTLSLVSVEWHSLVYHVGTAVPDLLGLKNQLLTKDQHPWVRTLCFIGTMGTA